MQRLVVALGQSRRLHGPIASFLLALLAACNSAPPPEADPAAVAARKDRLIAPFQVERIVVADQLEIVMTANFYADLTRPAVIDGLQDEQRVDRPDGGSETTYKNRSPSAPLRFILGGTDFRIVRGAHIVVLGRSDMRLDADLQGAVTILEAGARKDFRSVRIAEGAFSGRS